MAKDYIAIGGHVFRIGPSKPKKKARSGTRSSKATTWYRAGTPPADRPVWLARSRDYAEFYGEDVDAYLVKGRVLDLSDIGIDIDTASIARKVGPEIASVSTSSGEMYEWAENAAPQLAARGWSGVVVRQWHAGYSDKPQRTMLVLDRSKLHRIAG